MKKFPLIEYFLQFDLSSTILNSINSIYENEDEYKLEVLVTFYFKFITN